MVDIEQAVQDRVQEIQTAETAATDFKVLLDALPPGQVKQLYKDETCAAILAKYGVQE